jgi:hypothetical protein
LFRLRAATFFVWMKWLTWTRRPTAELLDAVAFLKLHIQELDEALNRRKFCDPT